MVGTIVNRLRDKEEWLAPASLFYSKDGFTIDAISIDLILEEQHSVDADVTSHPVQYGSEISDNISVKLREGSLRALVSNFDVKTAAKNGSGIFKDDGFLAQYRRYDEIRNYVSKAQPPENKAKKAWEDLKAVVDWKQPVKIVTALEVYENVVITHISTMRDGDTGECQEFDISFKQIRRVSLYEDTITESIVGKDMESPLDRTSAKEIAVGQKVGESMTEEEAQNLKDQGLTD